VSNELAQQPHWLDQPRDEHGHWIKSEADMEREEMTVVDAEVVFTPVSGDLPVRDSFQEWEIRLQELREEEAMLLVAGWSRTALTLLMDSDAEKLSQHEQALEQIGDWGQPPQHASRFVFEIAWDRHRAFPRFYVEEQLEALLRGQREYAQMGHSL
jgi:hypothetical protein